MKIIIDLESEYPGPRACTPLESFMLWLSETNQDFTVNVKVLENGDIIHSISGTCDCPDCKGAAHQYVFKNGKQNIDDSYQGFHNLN